MATTIKRQSITPPAFQAWYDTYHFSPATRVGDRIWVSGQVGMTPDGRIGEDIQAQARIAFESLKVVLEAAGASLADVVELMTFHTDLRGEVEGFAAVKDEYFPNRYPSWTGVGVTQLALPELRVEIRVVAVAGSGNE
ncbi:RidA family protein [Cupriavidus consociatus]|uniref:RidA family protein n=1 Tax=Cupriavidus consociatus TaxID=2821357 RepID=UPI001AE9D336|nr:MULTISPECIES: RidA family protein [unclassified Cupriavidus]MBP0620908.1 RidA family protein [Cupriavidus sp. LEh25]MDK2657573.1 RidA family protein [Cupriavidus sp. LEh21]